MAKKKETNEITQKDVDEFINFLRQSRKGFVRTVIEATVGILVWIIALGGLLLLASLVVKGLLWVFGF